jgi:hypothetical protein
VLDLVESILNNMKKNNYYFLNAWTFINMLIITVFVTVIMDALDFETKKIESIVKIALFSIFFVIHNVFCIKNRYCMPITIQRINGIIISINTQNKSLYDDIKTRLIYRINKKLLSFQGSKTRIIIPHYQFAKRLCKIHNKHKENIDIKDNKYVMKLGGVLKKTNNKCIIFMDVYDKGKKNGIENYEFKNKDCIVKHQRVPREIQENLAFVLSKAIKHDNLIEKNNDIKEFEKVSDIFTVILKFIIGATAFVSRCFDEAEKLLMEVYNSKDTLSYDDDESIVYIRDTIVQNLYNLYNLKLDDLYNEFQNKFNLEKLNEINIAVESFREIIPELESYYLGKIIYTFFIEEDVGKCRRLNNIMKQKFPASTSFSLNDAFLDAFEDKYLATYRKYRTVLNRTMHPSLPFIELYLLEALKIKKNSSILLALTLFNCDYKRDYVVAREYFEEMKSISRDYSNNENRATKRIGSKIKKNIDKDKTIK